jgi:hypothetical protein
MLGHMSGPGEPATRKVLCDLSAEIKARQEHWSG